MNPPLNHRFLIAALIFIGLNSSLGFAREVPDFTPRPKNVLGIDSPVINLNGTWQFLTAPSSKFWRSPSLKRSPWEEIQVPGEWVMQGFEVEADTRAAYGREIAIPSSWKGHVILLKCDGVYSDSRIYVNGKLAGTHEGGFTPFQLDMTDLIRPGKINTLIIGVQNESLADTLTSATQYAAHPLGGITRKLELYALPETYVKSLHYSSKLDENNTDAEVVVDLVLANRGKQPAENLKLKINITEKSGLAILFPGNNEPVPTIPPNGEVSHQITIPIREARLWDPEHPNLYYAQLSLISGQETIEKTVSKIGIREIDVIGNQVFVNGYPIKLRGINRHEVHPTKGRSLSRAEWEADAHLFKEANVNYIRTSHYPPPEEFIALCDSIGFFVECEAPLCWVGHGANSHWIKEDPHSDKLYSLIHNLVLETVAQYRNHPSVTIWSMANESAWGPIWEAVLTEVNTVDPTRPVSFHDQAYGGYNNYGNVNCQIANIHYPGPGGPEIAWKFDRPLLFGEYAHLNTYNRQEIVTDPGVRDAWGRGLESMWENMYHSTGCLGGAIWSGVDDVFYLPSGKAVGYGEWGPIDGWRRPKPEYWHLKKIYSPVKITTRQIPVPDDGQKTVKIAVENRHLFTNMSELDIQWQLGDQSGKARMNLPPRASGILTVNLETTPKEKDQLLLSFYSPQEFLIDSYSIIFSKTEKEKHAGKIIKPELMVFENRVAITMGEEVWSLNAVNGKLESIRKGDTPVLVGGPDLMMLPLRTGPCNTGHSLDIQPLNDVCSNWNGKITGTGAEGDAVFVKVGGSYDEADIELIYWFGRSAEVEIEYEIIVKADIDPRQIGLVFTMPRDFEQLSWKRLGQWTIYPETHLGRTSGKVTPFPNGKLTTHKYGERPGNIWEADMNEMGSNDFRATRDKLYWGSLTNKDGHGIKMISDGSGAIRAFVGQNQIHFLAAGFSTAGGDLFFSSHLEKERNPLKVGDSFKSKLIFDVL